MTRPEVTGQKTTEEETTFGIDPGRVYRKYDKRTQEILGLRRSAINQAIEDGHIPPPMPLTESGSAVGWLGSVLIAVQRKRLAKAEAWQASPVRKNARKKKGGGQQSKAMSR